MIIFGWNHQTIWVLGSVFKQMCDHCHNEDYWVLMRRTTWFTLFFIPVIPYRTEWMLLCPVCKYGLELNSDQLAKVRPVAEANQMLTSGKITEVQYRTQMEALSGVVTTENKPTETETVALAEAKPAYCGECGKNLLPEGRFCIQCGTKTQEPTTV
ncbi:hypothetical protein A2880_02790 [Candidatus Peribacteria bacterium RIFCSPHIGHO2_01_FULL_49_38]|nr:MAG: hypothetical protein A2880_02790 [Candidatus Peribacteria bacterium RIFCSPHIGHO2_01_FULL_49_38]